MCCASSTVWESPPDYSHCRMGITHGSANDRYFCSNQLFRLCSILCLINITAFGKSLFVQRAILLRNKLLPVTLLDDFEYGASCF